MAVGTVSKALLTEIANAIREQNGQQVRYMPLEMSSRVLEMDGTREGVGLVAAPEAGTGVLSEVVFELHPRRDAGGDPRAHMGHGGQDARAAAL